MSFFKTKIEFVHWIRPDNNSFGTNGSPLIGKWPVSYSFAVNSGSRLRVYVNSQEVLDTGSNELSALAVDCFPNETLVERHPITNETQQTGCCVGANGKHLRNFTIDVNFTGDSTPLMFKIIYEHEGGLARVQYN